MVMEGQVEMIRVEQIMTRDVETITPNASVWAAARKMRDLNIGFLPVCVASHMVGVVTDRDITIRAVAKGLDPALTTVGDVMTPGLISCLEDQEVEVAGHLMNAHQIRRLVVLDRGKNLVGVVSLGDLAVDALAEPEVGQVLKTISWPAEPERK
jgi:CBS domain-containing protein